MSEQRDNDSSEPGRRAPRTDPVPLSYDLGDDDDDDYDLQAYGISDGFRPPEVTQDQTAPPVARPSIRSGDYPVARAVSPRPSSISKPYPAHDGHGHVSPRSSGGGTDSPVMTFEVPYDGPTGPLHPYQMYPQDVRARTLSSATSSTASVSGRSYNGPRHPAHPYGIYPQNVVCGDDESGDNSQRQVQVGFPGRSDPYRRRLGPDGEEAADMIGPDGHTEQLPPYTRYPQEPYGLRIPDIGAVESTPVPPLAHQNFGIPGAGGIGLATRNPEFASMEDLSRLTSSDSRYSVASSFKSADHSINGAALVTPNEKGTGNWKQATRRKVWGCIPCWAVVLGVVVLCMLGVVVGTVIGTVIAPHFNKGQNKPPSLDPSSVPGYDPLPTVPLDLPPLPKGQYTLPLSNPTSSNKCIQDLSQIKAWNCDAISAQLVMTIAQQSGSADSPAYALDFTYNHSYTLDSFVYSYGVQPPSLTDQQLQLVDDTFQTELGPAWAFLLLYNKTIILPDSYLTPTNDASTVSVNKRNPGGFQQKGLAQSGEHPWICTWPDTILEVFIFTDESSSPNATSTNTSSSAVSMPTAAELSHKYRGDVAERQYDSTGHQDEANAQQYSHTSLPPTTTSSQTSTVPSTAQPTSSGNQDNFNPPPMPPPPYPPYPKKVKFQERRDPGVGGPPPTCRQVEIVADGLAAIQRFNASGFPIEVQIAETMPGDEVKQQTSYLEQPSLHPRPLARSDDADDDADDHELGDCGCIWWLS
ncbi:hypothetical protein GGR50DRAFT_683558 [Xylaria sp. CBS 124048]|nr:hypothetical protein GGR50DRAFT_683558 [Xylaria sp. CBS 124048]